MEKYFVIVDGKRLIEQGKNLPLAFDSREEAEAYVKDHHINGKVISSTEWRDVIQHGLAERHKS